MIGVIIVDPLGLIHPETIKHIISPFSDSEYLYINDPRLQPLDLGRLYDHPISSWSSEHIREFRDYAIRNNLSEDTIILFNKLIIFNLIIRVF